MNVRYLMHCVRHPKKAYAEYAAQEKKLYRRDGNDPDRVYYVIRCDLPKCGFFAIYTYVLDHLAYAHDMGYVPVLDIEQYDILYKEKESVNGTTDPWQYYFEPVSDVSLVQSKTKANVILSAIGFPHYKAIYYYADKTKNVLPSKEKIEGLYTIVEKYIKLRPDVMAQLEAAKMSLLGSEKALGVHVRGTDMYTEGKQHPIPTGKTKDFTVIDGIIRKHGITRILLCTDTESTVTLFREKYGDMVVTTQSVRQKDDSNTGIHKDKALATRRLHRYKMGLEVLTDMYLLSQCVVLMCGPSNVPFIAMVYNNNQYESIYYYA